MSNLGDNPLEVSFTNGRVTITIGVDELCHAVAYGLDNTYYDIEIINNEKFVEDIVNSLRDEEGDGTTVVHRMFDKAAMNAIENGSEWVEVQ